jgi:phosphatidate cytidylyltransferase
MSGLGGRIAVAVPLAAVVLYAVFAGGWAVALVALAAALVALHEFYAMTRELRPLTVAGFAGVAGIVFSVHGGGLAWGVAPLVLMLLAAFWFSALAEVRQSAAVQLSVTAFGVVWIGFGLSFLVAIRDVAVGENWGRDLLLAVLLGVWAQDTAAYGAGRLFGRRRLAGRISPNKTVEGLVVGLLAGAATVFFAVYNRGSPVDPVGPLEALELAAAVAVATPLGDLFESYLKRDMGVKDAGSILGGHGGMLDRIDALLFAAPVYYVVLKYV